MSNLFHRLANRAMGGAPQIRPQATTSFYSSAPLLEQNATLELDTNAPVMNESVNHANTGYEKSDVGQLEPGRQSVQAPVEFERTIPAYKKITDNLSESHTDSTGVLNERSNDESAFKPMMHARDKSAFDSESSLHAGVLNSPAGSVQSESFHELSWPDNPTADMAESENLFFDNSMNDDSIDRISRDTAESNPVRSQKVNVFKPLINNRNNYVQQTNLFSAQINSQQGIKDNQDNVEVHVSIGRIEVRAPAQNPVQTAQKIKKQSRAPMSLEAYLAERESGKR